MCVNVLSILFLFSFKKKSFKRKILIFNCLDTLLIIVVASSYNFLVLIILKSKLAEKPI